VNTNESSDDDDDENDDENDDDDDLQDVTFRLVVFVALRFIFEVFFLRL